MWHATRLLFVDLFWLINSCTTHTHALSSFFIRSDICRQHGYHSFIFFPYPKSSTHFSIICTIFLLFFILFDYPDTNITTKQHWRVSEFNTFHSINLKLYFFLFFSLISLFDAFHFKHFYCSIFFKHPVIADVC